MEHCSVTFCANAGFSLQLRGKRILVDALHNRKVPRFSPLSPEIWADMQAHPAFSNPDLIFFTHCHDDHFSAELTDQARKLWPSATLVLPEQQFTGQYLLCGREVKFTADGITLTFIRLTHEGEEYANVPHYGLLLETDSARILIAADCKVANPQLTPFLEHKRIDLAILEFPWLTLYAGKRYVDEIIRPRHLLINHIPFVQDDISGYRDAAIHTARQYSGADTRLLLEPLQTEHFYL